MNPSLRLFMKRLSAVKNIAVRTNLTALAMPGYRPYLRLYKEHRVKIIASLPCVYPDNVDNSDRQFNQHRSAEKIKCSWLWRGQPYP